MRSLISDFGLRIEKRKHGEGRTSIEYAGRLLAAFPQPAALATLRHPQSHAATLRDESCSLLRDR